jgi:hypothetical protein
MGGLPVLSDGGQDVCFGAPVDEQDDERGAEHEGGDDGE